MPNQGRYWTEANGGSGNQTRSRKVNPLIAAVKRCETRGLGQTSNADRAFTPGEFEQAVDLMGMKR